MKFKDAKEIIRRNAGFRVEFEHIEGGILASDHFPDNDEETIRTEGEAWEYAKKFAEACKDEGIVNVYVIHGDDYVPVEGYKERELNLYPPNGGN